MGETTYAEARDRLRDGLSRLAALAEERGNGSVAEAARALDKKLVEERFNAVVVGEFKRGKTTFVNALLGADVLPSAVVPLTSIVTAVAWGDEVRAEVFFRDGRVEEVAAEDLARFVTERENPGNRLGVDRAVLYSPAEELRDGVFLVDTPGVGSVYRHNTDAAYAFVPEADAAIFLTSADPPVSDGERGFLEDVRSEAARMFFVLNKIDYLSEPDREEAIAFTHGVLSDAVGHAVRLYPVSARRALLAKLVGDEGELEASGLPAFERDFRRFLMQEKGRTIVASVGGQLRKLLADERNSLEVEERTLRFPEEELARKAGEMERVFAEASRSIEDIRTLLRREAEKLVGMVEEDLSELRKRETAALLEEAEAFLEGREDLRSAADDLDALVKESLRRGIDRWRGEEERKVGDAFRQAAARFVEETNALVERTVTLCGEVLGAELTAAPAPAGIAPETRFTYAFFEVPTILESLLPDVRGFLPKAMARKLLARDVRERVPLLVDKHSGRLRWDFVQRLERSRIGLESALSERLEATIESLRLGVRRAAQDRARTAEEARQATARMAEVRRRLAGIEALLGDVPAGAEAAGGTR